MVYLFRQLCGTGPGYAGHSDGDRAHKFLNVLSNGAQKLRLRMSLHPQEGAGRLDLVEHCGAPKGGAIYRFTPPAGQANGGLFWICDLALLVFGDLPDRIYVQRLSPKDESVFHYAKKTGQNGSQKQFG